MQQRGSPGVNCSEKQGIGFVICILKGVYWQADDIGQHMRVPQFESEDIDMVWFVLQAVCTNLYPGVECRCQIGYAGDGLVCYSHMAYVSIADRGCNKAGPQAICPQNFARIHKMLRPWGPLKKMLAYSNTWFMKNKKIKICPWRMI